MSFLENRMARSLGARRVQLAALGAAAAATIAAATHPAAASDALAILTSTVKCATSAACVVGANTSNGAGVQGTSAKSNGVSGATASSSGTSAGVFGNATSGGYGVYGRSLGKNGYGVYGYGAAIGVVAASQNNGGNPGTGVLAIGSTAVNAASNHIGITAYGADVGVSAGSQSYPLLLQDGGGNDVFFVTSGGNVYYAGGLYNFARVQNGATVSEYTPKAAAPTLEDTGTAQLVAGAAQVRLDPTFAAGIDPHVSYRVFVTPRGDTRGLYVTAAGPAGFTVRENQGGRSTVSFDYRVVATDLGHPGERMAPVNTALMPRVATRTAMPALNVPPAP